MTQKKIRGERYGKTGHPETLPGEMYYEGAVQGGCQGLAITGPGEFYRGD